MYNILNDENLVDVCEEEETEREKQRTDALAASDGMTRRLVRLGDSACEET